MMKNELDSAYEGREREIAAQVFVKDPYEELQQSESRLSHIYFCVHGIRSSSDSFNSGKEAIDAHFVETGRKGSIKIIYIRYERISIYEASFKSKFSDRVNFVREQILNVISRYKERDVSFSVIAHSFGTKIFSEVCVDFDFLFENIIYMGSVSADNLSVYVESKCNYFINLCGSRDFFVVIAHIARRKVYSYNGYLGFRSGSIIDRYYNISHNDFLVKRYFSLYLLPVISEDILYKNDNVRLLSENFIVYSARVASFLKFFY